MESTSMRRLGAKRTVDDLIDDGRPVFRRVCHGAGPIEFDRRLDRQRAQAAQAARKEARALNRAAAEEARTAKVDTTITLDSRRLDSRREFKQAAHSASLHVENAPPGNMPSRKSPSIPRFLAPTNSKRPVQPRSVHPVDSGAIQARIGRVAAKALEDEQRDLEARARVGWHAAELQSAMSDLYDDSPQPRRPAR